MQFFTMYYGVCHNKKSIAVVSSSEDESEYQRRKCYSFLNPYYASYVNR